VGASVEVDVIVEVDVDGVVVWAGVVVIGVVSVVVVLGVIVVVVVIVVVSLDGAGSGVGVKVVTSGSPPLSQSELFLATVTGTPSLDGSSSEADTQVSEVSLRMTNIHPAEAVTHPLQSSLNASQPSSAAGVGASVGSASVAGKLSPN